MIDREKLVEIIHSSLLKNVGFSCNLAENIADDLLANGVMVQNWRCEDDMEGSTKWDTTLK